MFVLDAETMKVMLANQAAADIYGLNSVEEAVGVNLLDFVPPEGRERVLRITVKDMFENDLRQVNEFRTITKDGREIWISAVGTRTEYQGKIAGLVSFSDITERKQAEEAVRESNRRFRDIAEHTLEWIWEVDANGKYTYASSVVEKILGYEPEEVLKKHFYDLFYPDEREELKNAAFEVFAQKQSFREFVNRNMHQCLVGWSTGNRSAL